jgi:hypothetical protein
MSLEQKSRKLKDIVATYDSEWLLGDLSFVMHAGRERARDQLSKLSSPLRQLYYLAGLNVSSDAHLGKDFYYSHEKWDQIVALLNEIEDEYQKLFLPNSDQQLTEAAIQKRHVAMSSFLSYFNQGPLNYEEQVIRWIRDLFTPLNDLIESQIGLKTEDLIQFYNSIDQLNHKNFQAHSTRKDLLRENWESYTKIKMGVPDDAPDFIREMGEKDKHLYYFMSDKGIKDRFYPKELVGETLSLEKVTAILQLLSIKRAKTNFLYYTETKPGNPLYERPILDLENGMFQVFEVKQVIHAIAMLLEQICTSTEPNRTRYVKRKGNLLEDHIADLMSLFFKKDFKIFKGYYVDGFEQDVLILWRSYAFIIEAKGYSVREPFRNPEKAFVRIKDDFDSSIGYGYIQANRVSKKFKEGSTLLIADERGTVIDEVDTTTFDEDFTIIVNLKSFGQSQCDLSMLLNLENEDSVYPWAVKLDDLEIFLLTMIALKKDPTDLVDFLLMRETLHGKLICADELEVCGGYLKNKFPQSNIDSTEVVVTAPNLSDIFDHQYLKGMGFKDEKFLNEKQSGNYLFW